MFRMLLDIVAYDHRRLTCWWRGLSRGGDGHIWTTQAEPPCCLWCGHCGTRRAHAFMLAKGERVISQRLAANPDLLDKINRGELPDA